MKTGYEEARLRRTFDLAIAETSKADVSLVCRGSNVRTKANMKVKFGLVLLTLVIWSKAYSGPMLINILDAHNTTTVSLSRYLQPYDGSITNFTRTQVSPGPASDTLANPATTQPAAIAYADLFNVVAGARSSAGMDPYIVRSVASATSEIWFSPVSSQASTIGVHFSGDSRWAFGSEGAMRLLNVTTGVDVWNYEWNGAAGTIAGVAVTDFNLWSATATLQLDADLNAADTYRLILRAETFAGDDPESPSISLQLFGLESVSVIPEPSILSLVGFGALTLVLRRQRGQGLCRPVDAK